MVNPSAYGIVRDQYNHVTFAAIEIYGSCGCKFNFRKTYQEVFCAGEFRDLETLGFTSVCVVYKCADFYKRLFPNPLTSKSPYRIINKH